MSKVFKAIGTIAAVVSTVAAFIPGGQLVSAIAGGVALAANIGAQLTAKKPAAQGSLTQILIQSNAPTPYLMGETYFGGVMRHDVGYGGKVSKVQNPYRGMPVVYSGCGPVQGLVGMFADFISVGFSGAAATGYYAGFLYRSYQLGATPEAGALTAQWPGMPGWSSAHKLSGKAAILWSLKFDKEGEKYAGGVPQFGAVWQGVKVYDPRLDSTYPGGSGSHRIDNEATWTYSQNPALHALAYSYGRYKSGKKIFGIGLSKDGLDLASFVAWANVCAANNWKVGGVIFEPGDRWANLKRIMAAGSAEPIFAGGVLSVKYDAPRVSLVTITGADFAEGARVRAMQSWRDRKNTWVPKYRSAAHKWEYVESAAVTSSVYLAEDGEEKVDTYQIDLCQDKDQAAQLTAYKLVNGREIAPIEITLKPGFRFYRPGDMVTINEPELGLINQDCVILTRVVDPQNFTVTLTLMSETTAKHDFALGKTGTAPPTPTLTSSEDKDNTAQTNALGGEAMSIAFKRSATQPSTPGDSTGTPATWYPDTGSVPSSANQMWATYGTRENSISDFVWQTPVPVEGLDGSPGSPGAPGTDAKLMFVTSNILNFPYDAAGSPKANTATIIATRQNAGAETTQWRLEKADGTLMVDWTTAATMVAVGGATSAPSNDTLTLTSGQFEGIRGSWANPDTLVYRARLNTSTTIEGKISLTKVQDGAPGTAGAPGAPGSNGVTYYTWYAYADAPDGSFNFTTGAPGGRFYQGIAYNKTTATESTNPADYAWAPYEGPPNFGLANFNSNTVIAGNKLIKVAGDGNWNASIHSTESFKGGATVSFVVDNGPNSFMVGLNTDPTTDASYSSLDFAIYIAGTTVQVYESAYMMHERTSFSAVGDVWTVTYNGKSVVYSKNGTPFYTNSSPAPNLTLFLDSSMSTPGMTVPFGRILAFAAAGPAGTDGATGSPGAPGAPGNKTVRVYRRSSSAPSTPTGNVPPSGWSTTIPADDGTAVWASDVETQSNGTTVVGSYTTPVMFQAATPIAGNTTVAIDSEAGASAAILRSIPAGGTLPITARIRTQVAGGSGTQFLRIEWRVKGGTYATLGTEGSNAYAFGERGVVSKSETFTNSSGVEQLYEFRAFTRVTGSPAGVDETRSYITA